MKSGWYESPLRRFKIEQVVGVYDVWTGDLPFSHLTLKVVACAEGGFRATPNVFYKSGAGIDYCCGAGNSIEPAVNNAIQAFYDEISKYAPLDEVTESDFVWLCWTPFGSTPFFPSS